MKFNGDYRRLDYYHRQHHIRFERFVESMPRQLTCQECGGAGGEKVPILDYGEGLWEPCGWCEGTGLVSPWLRGQWLKYKRSEHLSISGKRIEL